MAVTDINGTSTHVYGYDDIYQVTDVNYPEEFDCLATDTTFNYDGVGNRTSVVDDEGTVTYTANEPAENGDGGAVEERRHQYMAGATIRVYLMRMRLVAGSHRHGSTSPTAPPCRHQMNSHRGLRFR